MRRASARLLSAAGLQVREGVYQVARIVHLWMTIEPHQRRNHETLVQRAVVQRAQAGTTAAPRHLHPQVLQFCATVRMKR